MKSSFDEKDDKNAPLYYFKRQKNIFKAQKADSIMEKSGVSSSITDQDFDDEQDF